LHFPLGSRGKDTQVLNRLTGIAESLALQGGIDDLALDIIGVRLNSPTLSIYNAEQLGIRLFGY
jgi:hypothetical protein